MGKVKGMMWGGLTGSLIAATFALLGSRDAVVKKIRSQTSDWADKARNIRENVFEDMRDLTESRRVRTRKTFARGAALGLLVGAGVAALLTPKSGKQLRNQISNRYQGVAEKTTDILHYFNQNGHRRPEKKLAKVISKKRRAAAHR